MLENAWIIPIIPAASFAVILLLGKRLPFKGSEIGTLAVAVTFVLSCVAAFQWIDRVSDADAAGSHGGTEQEHGGTEGEEHGGEEEHGLGVVGRSLATSFSATPAVEAGEEGHSEVAEVRPVVRSWTWWQNGGTTFGLGTQIDGLASMMMVVVGLISLLVHIYSLVYMHGDRRFTHYYAALSLFTASMLTLVVADNSLQLLFGWELVGLCSFMLIGHWWEEKPNSDAALKAFFTTRTGDIGLLIGVIVTFFAAGGTFSLIGINEAALGGEGSHLLWLVGASTLFIGVIGKSGQFPLHTWLPDAMAGPTPVSALIHAATMVVAGVYLVARLYGVFWEGFSIEAGGINFMAAIGGATIIIGALLAFVQSDIKKVLAYSTISQLGYMVMGMGVGGWVAAVFHLFTHAFFKACLFLGAGSISHSGSHHSFDMKKDMGGLRRYMPQTFITFIIGTAALTGFPFLAGFWSKDEIIATAGETGYYTFFYVGLVGAFLTALYMTRCVYLTFFGQYRGHGHPHESPLAITGPLWILAFLSITAGFLQATAFDIHLFQDWVEPRFAFPPVSHPEFEWSKGILAIAIAFAGYALMAAYYTRKLPFLVGLTSRNPVARAGYAFLANRYYLDHLYTGVIVGGIKRPIARATNWFNQHVLDGIVNGTGRGATLLGRGVYRGLDQAVIDGIVNGTGRASEGSGGVLRLLQTGRVQQYGALLFGAAAVGALVLVLTV